MLKQEDKKNNSHEKKFNALHEYLGSSETHFPLSLIQQFQVNTSKIKITDPQYSPSFQLIQDKNSDISFYSKVSDKSKKIRNKAMTQTFVQNNRLKFCEQIKIEENCFKLRLKMISILRTISHSGEDIKKYQAAASDQFISLFQKRIKKYVQDSQGDLRTKQHLIEQLKLKIRSKQLQFSIIKAENQQLCIHSQKLKQHSRKEANQYKIIINSNDSQIKKLSQIIKQLQKQLSMVNVIKQSSVKSFTFAKTNSIFSEKIRSSLDSKVNSFRENKKFEHNKVGDESQQQKLLKPIKVENMGHVEDQRFILQSDFKNKLTNMIIQWKQILYRTVDYYEELLQQKGSLVLKNEFKYCGITMKT